MFKILKRLLKKSDAENKSLSDEYLEIIRKFGELGIKVIGTESVSLNVLKRIYFTIEYLNHEHHEIGTEFLKEIHIGSFSGFIKQGLLGKYSSGGYGTTLFALKNENLYVKIFLNIDKIADNDTLLKREKVIGCNDGFGLESIVTHEYAHVLEFYILYSIYKWNELNPTLQEVESFLKMEEDNKCNFISKETELINICTRALNALGFDKYRILDDACNYLGGYAGKNYQECFAEAFSQYYCSSHPTKLAELIVCEYNDFIETRKDKK